jgi:hypothetical protein
MIRLATFLLALCLASAAHAQTPPYTYPLTLGTSSVTILAPNNARKKLIFHDPNDTAKIAVCPRRPEPNRAIQPSADRRGHQRRGLHHVAFVPER